MMLNSVQYFVFRVLCTHALLLLHCHHFTRNVIIATAANVGIIVRVGFFLCCFRFSVSYEKFPRMHSSVQIVCVGEGVNDPSFESSFLPPLINTFIF